jgi:hypothetical protein
MDPELAKALAGLVEALTWVIVIGAVVFFWCLFS